MPLAAGTKLGPYEILAPLGAGGMGEVYKARDTRLGRDVAIKISSEQFSERFEREARSIAALNHPNICHLYDVGPNYLVMELIDGVPIRGPLPLDQALKYAAQICSALDAAHRKGITHRDLKPANILLTKAGIKLLDFGLAKQSSPLKETDATEALTQHGAIVGTLHYMSPEQLQSKEVDARSDIFSFGLVLYEMLTGKRAFEGSSAASVIAAILERPAPSVSAVAPAALDRVLQKCLAKDPDDRWQSARDLKDELEWIANAPEPAAQPEPSRLRLGWIVAAIAMFGLLALGIQLWAPWRAAPDPPKVVRFQIEPPEHVNVAVTFALSPDGTKLAYHATGPDGVMRIWLRRMDALDSQELPGTETPSAAPIFWSSDSRFVVFSARGKFKKVDVAGGLPLTLCDVASTVVGGSENHEGVMLFAPNLGTIQRISSAGGVPASVTSLDAARKDNSHAFPVFLPDGRHFLYLVRTPNPDDTGIYLGSLDAKPREQDRKRLVATRFGPGFLPPTKDENGSILFEREGTLFIRSFNLRRLETVGSEVPIVEQVGSYLGSGFFSASVNGTLVYRGNWMKNQRLSWFDRQGKILSTIGDPHRFSQPAISPDGMRIAVVRSEPSNWDIWLAALPDGGDTRFTFDPARDDHPIWSPDSKRIAFSSDRIGQNSLYQHLSNGAGQDELLLKSDRNLVASDWSHDGRFLLYWSTDPSARRDIWVLPLEGTTGGVAGERKPSPFLRSTFNEYNAKFSPDDHWVAYESDESGRDEIYVRPFPVPEGGGGRWMISHGGGTQPRWRGDGKELFYISQDGSVIASPVSANGGAFQSGPLVTLFKVPPNLQGWDVSADGKRFLIPVPVGDIEQAPFTVIQNWTSLLKKTP